jgi:hypothetical protein
MPARSERVEVQEPSDANVWFLAEYESVIGPPGKRSDYKKKASFDAAKSIFDRKGGWHQWMKQIQMCDKTPGRSSLPAQAPAIGQRIVFVAEEKGTNQEREQVKTTWTNRARAKLTCPSGASA